MFASKKLLSGTAGAPKVYVEDVFSTYLYTGTGANLTITNNIDLSTEGGMVWFKNRNGTLDHAVFDTARGATKSLRPNDTVAEATETGGLTSFNSNGFSLGNWSRVNYTTSDTYVSWTFRKAKKFFDVVTYTGNGTAGRTISHNLGSTPGCIIVKNLTNSRNWNIYHRSAAKSGYTPEQSVTYFTTSATTNDSAAWNDTAPTSTIFTVGADLGVNASGSNYVAYLFAHDAGGFGTSGSDNVISCGSFTGSTTVNLGYEPQWLLWKRSDSADYWNIADNMRGFTVINHMALYPDLSNAEDGPWTGVSLNNTGFVSNLTGTYIYISIRRGPMKTPTSGTSVYNSLVYTGNQTARNITGVGFVPDLVIGKPRDAVNPHAFYDRLRGATKSLQSTNTDAEATYSTAVTGFDLMDGIKIGTDLTEYSFNYNTKSILNTYFRRAPGFFDVVCYNGTGVNRTVSHNLGAVPELIIVKARDDGTSPWRCYAAPLGATKYIDLNSTGAAATSNTPWNDTTPTSSVFTVGTSSRTNDSALKYVAYLFASVSGVSKVGSYTGNGSSVTVTTNFQPRFILVKRTDSTGDWIISDSARGLVAGNDPYLLLNSTAAEDTDEDWVDITSTSFTVNQTTAANANVNTGTYIYLAIA